MESDRLKTIDGRQMWRSAARDRTMPVKPLLTGRSRPVSQKIVIRECHYNERSRIIKRRGDPVNVVKAYASTA